MTDAPPPTPRPLHVEGHLRVQRDGHTLDVRADGRRITINAPTVAALRQLMDPKLGVPRDFKLSAVSRLTDALARYDVDVDVQLKGHTIATVGADADPGWLEKALRLHGVDLKARNLLKALFHRSAD